ncbi:MAG TPA: alpha/beta hydrolase, partial [Gemmatimonadaceae bacterium]
MLAAAGVLVLAVVALLWWMQERIAYQPQGPPFPEANGTARVNYTAADGQPLFGYLVGNVSAAPGVVLAFHGNADLAAWQIPWAEAIAGRTGYAVFLAEYRGYMGLPGRPTYRGLRLDAHAAHDYLTGELGVESKQIVVFGHSLGSAVAAELAAERPPRALLLQSPFTSSHDLARRLVTLPIASVLRLVSRVPYDTRARVEDLEAPVWVIHGARDMVIPVRMGRAVHEAGRRKGGLVIVETAGHNDLGTAGQRAYWSWLHSALSAASESMLSENRMRERAVR